MLEVPLAVLGSYHILLHQIAEQMTHQETVHGKLTLLLSCHYTVADPATFYPSRYQITERKINCSKSPQTTMRETKAATYTEQCVRISEPTHYFYQVSSTYP